MTSMRPPTTTAATPSTGGIQTFATGNVLTDGVADSDINGNPITDEVPLAEGHRIEIQRARDLLHLRLDGEDGLGIAGRAHEGRNTGIARAHLGIGEFGVAVHESQSSLRLAETVQRHMLTSNGREVERRPPNAFRRTRPAIRYSAGIRSAFSR